MLKEGFFCGSEAWITDRNDHVWVLKMLVLYRSSVKVQNKMLFSPDYTRPVFFLVDVQPLSVQIRDPDIP